MIRYNELLKRKLEEPGADPHNFFRYVHVYLFGTAPDLTRDVLEWEHAGIVPLYCITYFKRMEQTSCK